MNEDEQVLRAQLRTAYQAHRANIDGLDRWIKAKVLTLADRKTLEEAETPEEGKAAALFGRAGQIEDMARRVLDVIADDQEIDHASRLLRLPKVFARIPDVSYGRTDDRLVAWPNKPAVPHEVRRPTQTLLLVYPAIDAWIKYLSDVGLSPDGLIPESRSFLKAMLDLGLHGGKRQGQDLIWSRVCEIGQVNVGKQSRATALKLLKDRQLVDVLAGTGTTLTDNGLKLAESLK